MPQALLTQKAFNSGELSPLAISRSDTAPYKNGLAGCRNMIPTPVGPVVKRSGTRYVAPCANESQDSRLVPFSYSNIQSYIFEFAENEIRFFSPSGDGGWVVPAQVEFDSSNVDTSNNTVGINQAHYLRDGAGPLRLTTEGTLPTGLSEGTDYYAVLDEGGGASSLGFSLTSGGSAVSISGAGSGTHYITPDSSIIQSIPTTYTQQEIWEIDFVPSGDILYITHQNHPPRQLERRTASGFAIRDMFLIDGPWEDMNKNLGIGMNPSTSPSVTQTEPNVFEPGSVDPATDTITIPNHGYDDRQGPFDFKTTGTLPAGLSLGPVQFYFIILVNEHQFQVATTAGGAAVTITDRGSGEHSIHGRSNDNLVMNGDLFNTDSPSKDLLRRFRYRGQITTDGTPEWGWGIIDEVTDAKTAVTQVHRDYGVNLEVPYWRLGAFYSGNYPARCFIHEQRLWFADTPSIPTGLWGSVVGDFQNFAPDEGIEDYNDNERVATEASAIFHKLGAGQVDKFAFIAAVRQMIVGTTGAIWPIQATSRLETLTPGNINARPSAVTGAALVKPVLVADEIVYVGASNRKLLAIGFNFERDAFVPQDLSILANHFTEQKILQLAYTQEPHSVIWGAREDGLLVGVTYERSQRVLGWHGHTLGGTDAEVRSVAVTPDDDQSYDQLWMVVKRTVNGQTRRYIEYFDSPFYTNTELEDAPFLDSSLAPYDGTPVSEITGFSHLEGESVYAVADGVWIGPLTVVGGIVQLEEPASKIRVGLNFQSYVKLLPLESDGVPGGTLSDRTKSVKESFVHVHRTNFYQIGTDLDDLQDVSLAEMDDPEGKPTPLKTQAVDVLTDHGVGVDQSYYVASDKPVPLDITAITGRVEWAQR
jgi:hypothetical protein